jgi:hypothetical protein
MSCIYTESIIYLISSGYRIYTTTHMSSTQHNSKIKISSIYSVFLFLDLNCVFWLVKSVLSGHQ